MCDAYGIVNFESANVHVKGMGEYRPASAFSYLGRYRLVDFPLSNMSNSGIDQIKVLVKSNPRSLVEHLGNGRQYNLNSKRGRLQIIPAISSEGVDVNNTDICAMRSILELLEAMPQEYVIIAPPNMVYRQDLDQLLQQHQASGADISVLYQNVDNAKSAYLNCDVLRLNRQKGVLSIDRNRGNAKNRSISLETYVMRNTLLITLIKRAANTSMMYWLRDVVSEASEEYDVQGIAHRGYLACINDFDSYYHANMDLLDYSKGDDLLHQSWPFYTRTNDSCPTQYGDEVMVNESIVSNGCKIRGTVEKSVIGRGVVVEEGAVVRGCVILPGVYIGKGVHVENAVVDKKARIIHRKEILGMPEHPLYVRRRDQI